MRAERSSGLKDIGNPRRLRGVRVSASKLSLTTLALLGMVAGAVTVPVTDANALQPGEWVVTGGLTFGDQPVNAYDADFDHLTGEAYVLDAFGNYFLKFDAAGNIVFKKGKLGVGAGEFKDPRGITVDVQRNVYVTDTGNNRVQKFDRHGGYVSSWGTPGNGAGEFSMPSGIASDAEGNVYVSDTGNHRIQKFDSDGNYLTQWGAFGLGDKQFRSPMGLAVGPEGNVLVADALNHRIQVFEGNGDFLAKWGQFGAGAGQFQNPVDVSVDESNRVLVADHGNQRIQKLNLVGSYIDAWGTPSQPRAVVSDNKRGLMLVPSLAGTHVFHRATTPTFVAGPATRATIGRTYSSTLSSAAVPATVQYSLAAGTLPSGLNLAGNKISGIPKKVGTFQVAIEADNGVNPSAVKKYSITVGKATSRVTASFSTKRPKVRKTKIWVTIKLTAPSTTGLSRTGAIRVYAGSKRVKSATIYKSHAGVIKVRLPKFTKTGKTKITVRYFGNGHLKADKYVTYVRVR